MNALKLEQVIYEIADGVGSILGTVGQLSVRVSIRQRGTCSFTGRFVELFHRLVLQGSVRLCLGECIGFLVQSSLQCRRLTGSLTMPLAQLVDDAVHLVKGIGVTFGS